MTVNLPFHLSLFETLATIVALTVVFTPQANAQKEFQCKPYSLVSSINSYAFSVNYKSGPWTFGGFYYQRMRAESDATLASDDRLHALGLGKSYRISTRTRLYGAVHRYDLRDKGNADFDDEVILLGLRLTL